MVTTAASVELPRAIVDTWELRGAALEPISVGLINRTVLATRGDGSRLVLQRLHPIFTAAVNLDIEAITAHLAGRGITTPRLVPTRTGALWVEAADGVWRAQTFIAGRVVATPTGAAMARSAGGLVGRFHAALADLAHTFRFVRPGAHDTLRHLQHLADAVAGHADHDLAGAVRPVADAILAHGALLPAIPELRQRIIHGDLKLTNVVFDEPLRQALALVDLDTLAHGTIAVELGDALRSWCNPAGESDPDARFDAAIFAAAVQGYAAAAPGLLGADEIAAIAPGAETIALELASRFCADALEEQYFGWDSARYARRGEHALVRARSQLSLAAAIRSRREELGGVVRAAFAAGAARP